MGKLLVTGGMGHVGYETVRQAAEAGIEVVAQYMTTFREADAEAVGPAVTWAKCDLSDPYELTMLAAAHDIDGVIHTAAVPNDKLGYPQPLRTFQSNAVATELLLETARRLAWRRFILVSTGSVFQSLPDAVTPVAEDTNPTPKSLYAATKRSGELMTAVYADTYGVSAATVRISWIFGPPLVPRAFDGPRGPIPHFLRRALQGEVIDEPSGGDFAASFTFVPDCAAGLLALWEAETLRHNEYHLGSGRNYTTHEVAQAVKQAVPDAQISVGPGTAPWTDTTVMRGPLDCTRMAEELGFRPRHSLDEAVAAFADWMRANPERWGGKA
jgi:nucleoside-diphosphate-sugar epimerase